MRRITILDIMILIGATAAGLTLARAYIADVEWTYRESAINQTYVVKEKTIGAGVCILAPLTLATIGLRLPQPRPAQAFRQPGSVGVIVSLVFLVYELGSVATLYAFFQWSGRGPFGYSFYFMSRWWETIGPAVLAAWIAIWLTRAKREAPDWVEYLAQAVGASWIAMLVLGRIASAIW